VGRGTGLLACTPLRKPMLLPWSNRGHRRGEPHEDRQSYVPGTGITAYLKNGCTLEKAAMIANHASTRTTQLYDRRSDEVSLDEVERILI
jgi:hypothetical protein